MKTELLLKVKASGRYWPAAFDRQGNIRPWVYRRYRAAMRCRDGVYYIRCGGRTERIGNDPWIAAGRLQKIAGERLNRRIHYSKHKTRLLSYSGVFSVLETYPVPSQLWRFPPEPEPAL